ncbi:MAG TPA: hypothetical protein DCE24_08260 [Porphyromonadaceae bacterium]|nr:hypothetical protein [Porphyromonadaceae bacterium]
MATKHWTRADEELLRKCSRQRMKIEEVTPLFPDRTISAIRARCSILGVPQPIGSWKAQAVREQEREKERQKARKYLTCHCRPLEGFLKQCEADERSIAEAQTAAEGDCFFGRRCKQACGKVCVANMPQPILPGKEPRKRRRMNTDFEYCTVRSKKKCPLREKCLRAVTPPFSTPYWATGGRYNKETKQCSMFIPKEDNH